MKCTIRLASPDDIEPMLDIYAPYVRETAITFEYDVPELSAFRERYVKFTKHCPWLVCEIDGRIAGYAYAHPFHERAAYKWTVESSIYIDASLHGKNIGKALYTALLGTLKLQGFLSAFAGVTVPNIKSESLHASFGFKRIGTLPNPGFKNGRWHDVAYYMLALSEFPDAPKPTKAIWEVSDTAEFSNLMNMAASIVNTV